MKGIVAIVLLAFVLVVSSLVPAVHAQKPQLITMSAGWVVGTYYPLAGTFSRIVYKFLPGVRLTVEASGASVATCKLIDKEITDFGLTQNDVAYYAYNALAPFEEPVKNIRGVASFYPGFIQILVRKDAGIKSVADLKGKKVAVGPLGSGTEVNTRNILGIYGITFGYIKAEHISAEEAGGFLKEGRVDAAFFTGGLGMPAVAEPCLVADMDLVEISDDVFDKLKTKHPFYAQVVIPGGVYYDIEDRQSVTVLAQMVAHDKMSADLVYDLLTVIFDEKGLEQIANGLPRVASYITLESAVDGMAIPLHPGAQAYYIEKGILK
ncbi:MAG: TAXI family TRAP transporter solute-binding subunit [bacterium]